MEIRDQANVELRAKFEESADQAGIIEGYAAVFDSWSEDLGGFRERIRRGAFAKTLSESPDIRSTFNHDMALILGRTRSGTLAVMEDNHGLHFRVQVPKTSYGVDLLESVRRGDVNQCSFMFDAIKDQWTEPAGPGQLAERELIEVRLFELGPVTFPAYPETEATARSFLTVLAKMNQGTTLTGQDLATLRQMSVLADQVIDQVKPMEESADPDQAVQSKGTGQDPDQAVRNWPAKLKLIKTKSGVN